MINHFRSSHGSTPTRNELVSLIAEKVANIGEIEYTYCGVL